MMTNGKKLKRKTLISCFMTHHEILCDLCAQMKCISFSFSELPEALGQNTKLVFSHLSEVCENRMKIGCGLSFGQTQRFFGKTTDVQPKVTSCLMPFFNPLTSRSPAFPLGSNNGHYKNQTINFFTNFSSIISNFGINELKLVRWCLKAT